MNLVKEIFCNNKEIVKEYLEIGLDELLRDDILKEIPVVGTVSAFLKTGSNIRNAFFNKKLIHFLYNMCDIPHEERTKIYEKT